jgi:hypothetical protein
MTVRRRTEGQVIFKALDFNVIDNGDRHLKGKLAEMIWDRIYRCKLVKTFTFVSSSMLQMGGHRLPLEEPSESEIMRMGKLLDELITPNIFSDKDIKFLLTKVAHGRGPPAFDYVGIERANNKKAILDVKSCSKTKNLPMFSSNEREVITEAKALAFDVYVAAFAYLQNWDVEMRLIKL